jgi:hypothetical protein
MEKDPSQRLAHLLETRAADAGLSVDGYVERVERRFQGVYTLCLASISLVGYTLLFRLVYRRGWHGPRGWRGPFTLALHYLAFVFIVLPAIMVAMHLLSAKVPGTALVPGGIALSGGIVLWWLVAAARRLFDEPWAPAIAKGIAILIAGSIVDQGMFFVALKLTLILA